MRRKPGRPLATEHPETRTRDGLLFVAWSSGSPIKALARVHELDPRTVRAALRRAAPRFAALAASITL